MNCPLCNSEMRQRQGKTGAFWGCTQYPTCKGTVNIGRSQQQPLEKKEEKRNGTDAMYKSYAKDIIIALIDKGIIKDFDSAMAHYDLAYDRIK